MMDLRFESILKVRELLTPEQRKLMFEQFEGKFGDFPISAVKGVNPRSERINGFHKEANMKRIGFILFEDLIDGNLGAVAGKSTPRFSPGIFAKEYRIII